jgi:type I restriction enzyme R subunit
MTQPEQEARNKIDELLRAAGWVVSNVDAANITAHRGVAIREFPLKSGHGFADYLLYVDGKAAGVIEAKKVGHTLKGVEIQSDKYTRGLPDGLPLWHNPLPFAYQSTGVETRFTNGLDHDPRSRGVFSFHRPETLAQWLEELTNVGRIKERSDGSASATAEAAATYDTPVKLSSPACNTCPRSRPKVSGPRAWIVTTMFTDISVEP